MIGRNELDLHQQTLDDNAPMQSIPHLHGISKICCFHKNKTMLSFLLRLSNFQNKYNLGEIMLPFGF